MNYYLYSSSSGYIMPGMFNIKCLKH